MHDTGRPLGVGMVGLSARGGWAARGHLRALQAVDGIELRALATSSASSARAAAAAYGVPGYRSAADLARDPHVDLVVVAVKVPAHLELVHEVLAAGIPVFVEWPLAINPVQAEEMRRAAGSIPNFVGLQGRSSPTFRWLSDLVAGGYVGEVLSATVSATSSEWGTPVSERQVYSLDRELGATMLTIAFGHAIDLVTMVVGEFEEVVATTATRRREVPLGHTGLSVPMTAEDQIAISGTVSGGAVVSAHHRGGVTSGAGFSFLIEGTEGRIDIVGAEFPHIGPVTVRGARGSGPLAVLQVPTEYDIFPQLSGTMLHSLAHAYSTIRDDLVDGTAVAPDFRHAVRRHRLLGAIQESAATGRRVAASR